MLRVACLADLHGYLPYPVQADLAVIAGDLCPEGTFIDQYAWFYTHFQRWLLTWECEVVYIAGNHDYLMARWPGKFPGLPWHTYLQDSTAAPLLSWEYRPHQFTRVHGMPWSLPYGQYEFMANEAMISWKLPSQTDILVSHGPAYGIGDVGYRKQHAGSRALLEWIKQTKPKLVVHGHIYEGYGVYEVGDTIVVNAAIRDGNFEPKNPIILADIP
jgi:predicted phosphodiesterase